MRFSRKAVTKSYYKKELNLEVGEGSTSAQVKLIKLALKIESLKYSTAPLAF
jgi:hypothetical protein